MREYSDSNRTLWDEWTQVNARSEMYDLEGFLRGGLRVQDYEIGEVGDITGKSLLHLQCHFGLDTLSWARLGAKVTGADFSPAAVGLARRIAGEIGIDATFVESDLYALPGVLQREFDVVYTGRGAICWLPSIERWAQVAAGFVRPGGFLYLTEAHPIAWVLEGEDVEPGELRLRYPYWERDEPVVGDVQGSYSDPSAEVESNVEYSWSHGLGEIVQAIVSAGLRIESLVERPFLEWKYDFLVEIAPGRWGLPPGTEGEFPLSFSLKASKPAV